MFNIFGKSKKPVAVVLYDGRNWYVEVFLFDRKEIMSLGNENFQGNNPLKMPDEITAFALKNGAKRIRILVSADVYVIDLEISDDLELDEVQAATAFELTEFTDLEADQIRPGSVRADLLGMGGAKTSLLTSPFENRTIEIFEESCKIAGAWFEGLGSLELGILVHHAAHFPEERCLIIRPRNSMYIAPASNGQPFSIQTLAVTFSPKDKQEHPERYERVSRVLNVNLETALHIWHFRELDTAARDIIRNETEYATDLLFYNLQELFNEISARVADTHELDEIHNIAMFVGKEEELKDPYRAGSWMFLIFSLSSILAMGSVHHNLSSELENAKERLAAYETLTNSRNSLSSSIKAIKEQRTQSMRVQTVLSGLEASGIPAGLLLLFETLREQMPVYTKINHIYEDESNVLVVKGSSFYQEAIEILSRRISQVLRPEGLLVEPGSIETDKLTGELLFTLRISVL